MNIYEDNMKRKKSGNLRRVLLSVACLAFTIIPVVFWAHASSSRPTLGGNLNFVPDAQPFDCESLFNGSAADNFKLSPRYNSESGLFLKAVDQASVGSTETLGYDAPYETSNLYKALHYIASSPDVRTVCATGFNYGVAALHFLTANEHLVVYAFGPSTNATCTLKMADYLMNRFPKRLRVYRGDTIRTIPTFMGRNHFVRCDVMLVSGAVDYHAAKADLTNFARIASVGKNYVVFTDHRLDRESVAGVSIASAWEESCESGMIEEKMRCDFKRRIITSRKAYRGIVIGSVRRGPTEEDGIVGGARDRDARDVRFRY